MLRLARVEHHRGAASSTFRSAAIPFRDNIDEAARHGVRHVAEPGGALRSAEVESACRDHGILRLSGMPRLFHH